MRKYDERERVGNRETKGLESEHVGVHGEVNVTSIL